MMPSVSAGRIRYVKLFQLDGRIHRMYVDPAPPIGNKLSLRPKMYMAK